MNRLLIVAMGCLPLGWLTVTNVLKWKSPVESSATAGHRSNLDLFAIDARAAATVQKAAAELPFLKNLVGLEPFTDKLLEIDAANAPIRFQSLARAWADYSRVHSETGKLAKLYRSKLAPDKEVERLTSYLTNNSLSKLSGGEVVVQWCEERRTTLSATIAMAEKLEDVHNYFQLKQHEKVISAVNALPLDVLSSSERAEVEKMRLKSQFVVYWEADKWTGETTTASLLRSRVKELDRLLNAAPPPADIEDENLIKKRQQERIDYQRRIVIEDLFDLNPELFDLADAIQRIMAEDPGAQERLVVGWKKWISSRVAPKVPPTYLPNEKEAWEKSGRYRRGVFEANKKTDPSNGVRYYFWNDPKLRTDKKTYTTEITMKELVAEPKEMLEIRVCREYNAKLAELLKKSDNLQVWTDFQVVCEKLEQEVDDYYSKLGAERRPVSFDSDVKLARDVVEQWPKLGTLFK